MWTQEDRAASGLSLLELLCRFRESNATDPKDKIYAFRGLAADRDSVPPVHYSHKVEEIYKAFARHFVLSGEGLRVIDAAGISRRKLVLPPWVPDWSVSDHVQQYFNTPHTTISRSRRFVAGGSTPQDLRLCPDGTTLLIKGVLFDRILVTAGPLDTRLHSPYTEEDVVITINKMLR